MSTPKNEFFHQVVLAAKLLKRRFEALAQPHGLTMPQWRVLGQLNEADAISQVTLAGLIEADPMTVSGLVERLEAKNLVRREPNPGDSRSKIVCITPEARELIRKMKALVDEVAQEAFAEIGAEERAITLNVLRRMNENLAQDRIADKEELV